VLNETASFAAPFLFSAQELNGDYLRIISTSLWWRWREHDVLIIGAGTGGPLQVNNLSLRVKHTKQDGLAVKYRCDTRLID
jgi:hypothetical protein